MIAAIPSENEAERLAALLAYDVLDTPPEQAFDDLTRIASKICGTPIALVSLLDCSRQWFKSRHGLGATETPRKFAFCDHAILKPDEMLIVPDSQLDERFHDNPLAVGEPHVRFYAGVPLTNRNGVAVGTLCVIDHVPRELTKEQVEMLNALARQTVSQLELRKRNAELREMGEAVQRANRELNQFTSLAAHDLRAPLRQLTVFSELLEKDLGDELPQRVSEDLKHIVASTKHMDKLVSALYQLSKSASGEIANESVALSDCVALALDAFGSRFGELVPQIQVDALPTVRGDSALLTQVFQNLLGNALKFTHEQPVIRIDCEEENGVSIIKVEDNGIGMDARHAERIFEPFVRLHSRSAFEGTGIGLALCRKIVERHGGSIWVESAEGEGCKFYFTLAGLGASAHAALAA